MTRAEIDSTIDRWRKTEFLFRTATEILNSEDRDVPVPLILLVAPFDRQSNGLMGVDIIYGHNTAVAFHLRLGPTETLQSLKEVLTVALPKARIMFPSGSTS